MYPLQLVHAHVYTPSFSCLHSTTFIEGVGREGSDAGQTVGVCERPRNACNWKTLCVNNLYHFALHCSPSEMHAGVLSKAVSR